VNAKETTYSSLKTNVAGDIDTIPRKVLESLQAIIKPSKAVRRRFKKIQRGETGIKINPNTGLPVNKMEKTSMIMNTEEIYNEAFNDEMSKIAKGISSEKVYKAIAKRIRYNKRTPNTKRQSYFEMVADQNKGVSRKDTAMLMGMAPRDAVKDVAEIQVEFPKKIKGKLPGSSKKTFRKQ